MAGPFYDQGRYACCITRQGLGEASTGTPQIILRFKVLEFENGEQVPAQYERTIYIAITDKTIPYVIEKLKKLGYTRDSFRFIDTSNQNYHEFRGQQVILFCKHEAGSDNVLREKWDVPQDSAGTFEIKKPLEGKKLRDLDNLFGKQLRDGLRGSSATVGPAPKNRAADQEITDDDIPF